MRPNDLVASIIDEVAAELKLRGIPVIAKKTVLNCHVFFSVMYIDDDLKMITTTRYDNFNKLLSCDINDPNMIMLIVEHLERLFYLRVN